MDQEICYFCNKDNIDGDSCMSCGKEICEKCLNEWYIMITIKKCQEFNVYGDYNTCINCAYKGNEKIPVFKEIYKIEYNIQLKKNEIEWYTTKCITELNLMTFNINNLESSIINFLIFCKRLDKFNIFDTFNKEYPEHLITFNQIINADIYDQLNRKYKMQKYIDIFQINHDINEKAKNKVELMIKCKSLQKQLLNQLFKTQVAIASSLKLTPKA